MRMGFDRFRALCSELFPGARAFQDVSRRGQSARITVYSAKVCIKGQDRELRLSYPVSNRDGCNVYTNPHTKMITDKAPDEEALKHFAHQMAP